MIRAMRHLLFLLLPQSRAELPVLLQLSSYRYRVHRIVVSGDAAADRGRPVVKDFVANLVRCWPAKLLLANLGRVVAMVLRGESGDMRRYLSCSVSGGTSETLQRDQASGRCSRLRHMLVRTSIVAEFLVAAFEHGSQNLRVVAVSLHLHLRLDALMVRDGLSTVVTLRAFRIMVYVVITWLQLHVLVIVELNIVEGAVPALDQCRLFGHRQAARRLLVLLLEVDVLLSQHE